MAEAGKEPISIRENLLTRGAEGTDFKADDTDLAKAQKGLAERPSISVRSKIIFGFGLFFFLCVVISIAFIVVGSWVDQKLVFMETINRYTFEIQQARRFEKNFFLYRTNLADALENIQVAREILKDEEQNIKAVIGQKKMNVMVSHLDRYENLLKELRTLREKNPGQTEGFSEIEGELRKHGAEMIFNAVNLVNRERQEVEEISRLSRRMPIVFLAILLGVMIYLGHFLIQQILGPLKRLMDCTQRIARGDFSPIRAARKYKDEFSSLFIAFNWMMDQLLKNQEQYIQSRKMAAVGSLTSGIAHELNNPLNNICLTTESMLDDLAEISEGEKRKRLQDIYTQAERASGVVRNLLDFTRMDKPSFVPLLVDELVSSTIKLARNEMELNNILLEYAVPEDLPKIRGDFGQIQQVFLNLIINSIQAMPAGGTLKITAHASGPQWVQIDVADSGMGISKSVLPYIFDPFFTTKEKGTGLGLSVSYSIIEKHGGKITVNSEINRGTTFSVFLPQENEKV
jgi:two-component system NtrC family sensor kinase